MMLTGRSRTKTVENLNFDFSIIFDQFENKTLKSTPRWRLASVKTTDHKIGFVEYCIAESTAYFYYNPQFQYVTPSFRIKNFEKQCLTSKRKFVR